MCGHAADPSTDRTGGKGPDAGRDTEPLGRPLRLGSGLRTGGSFGLLSRVTKETTQGISVEVESYFVPEQSDTVLDRYVFAYRIRIANESNQTVQLTRRHWFIAEGDGSVREVEGEGVVGEQPVMAPGETHEYMSGAILQGPVGTMHGTYEMLREDGTGFKAVIPRFTLQMPRTLH
jgi:ApaG protein